jgi:hypothetical protein
VYTFGTVSVGEKSASLASQSFVVLKPID